jgi:hypothetical protein
MPYHLGLTIDDFGTLLILLIMFANRGGAICSHFSKSWSYWMVGRLNAYSSR